MKDTIKLNQSINNKKMYKRKKTTISADLDVLAIPCECQNNLCPI